MKLEIHIVSTKPIGINLKVTFGAGTIQRTSELGDSIAFEGHIVHHLVRDRVPIGIEHVDGDIHRLFVSGEKEVVVRLGNTTHSRADGHLIAESRVVSSQSSGRVEALAAGSERHPHAVGSLSSAVR